MSGERTDPADWVGSYETGAVGGPAPIESAATTAGEQLAFPEKATWVMTRRALAHFADGLLFTLVFVALLIPTAAVSSVLATIVVVLFVLPGPVAYYVLTQRESGRSPGKRLAGIRVVDAEGRVPSIGALVRRSIPLLLEYFFLIAFLAMLFSPARQRLGDRWAHTYVIVDEG